MSGDPGAPAMDRERWRRVAAALDEALAVPAAELDARLDRACAGDPGLRAEVESLLRADTAAGAFLERPAGELVPGLFEDEAGPEESEAAGARVGPWRLVREIGRGGMGAVYLAERADGQYEQRVALKRIKRGLDTDEIVARFRQERQILARLEHPHIARLVDGGVADDGRPYVAMEYVDGVPLPDHCRDRRLGLPAVLRLFSGVCRAVEYAHRNLVVHRDLKPGNVLVTPDGSVKLLDFGIARVLEPGASYDVTVSPARRLTPRYAAPEQLRGDSPTTATDVYALGVMLYELLSGTSPYRPATGSSRDLERAVLESEPPPPSAATAPPGREPPWRAEARGDLDAITLMALRKEPERRYASVAALREDVERFLAGQPVLATRPTLRYRAGKFLRRNRGAVAAGSLVLVSLLAGLGGTAWQAREAARARDRALLEAKKAREIQDFTLGLFEVSDPGASRGATLTARDLLARGLDRVEHELAGEPAVRVDMLTVLARIEYALGEYPRAESLAARAVALARTAAPGGEALAAALTRLGIVRRDRSDFDGAHAALNEALALRAALDGPHAQPTGETLGELASVYRQEGVLDSAEPLYRRALEITRANLGPGAPELATDLDNLATLNIDRQRYDEALALQREALGIVERAFGHEHPQTALLLTNIAVSLSNLARYPEARASAVEGLRIRERVLGPDHLDLAHSCGVLAWIERDMGDYDSAYAHFERALEIETRALGREHPDVARDVNNLAILFFQRGEYARALARFRESLELRRLKYGPDDRGCLTMEHNTGVALRALGRYAEAERVLRDVRARRARLLGPRHLDVAASDHHLGVLMHLTGRDAEGERLLRAALALRAEAAGDSHQATAQTAEALATLLRDTGRVRESLPLYERAVAIGAKVFPDPTPQSAEAFVGLGRTRLLLGEPAAAEPWLRRALEVRRPEFGPGDPRTAEAAVALGMCLRALGRAEEGAPLVREGLPVLRAAPGRPDPLVAAAARPPAP